MYPDEATEELASWRRTFAAFATAKPEARILVRIYIGVESQRVQGALPKQDTGFRRRTWMVDGWERSKAGPQPPA